MEHSSQIDSKLAAFWRQAIRCRVCPTIAPYRKFPRASHGTTRYGLMIVGEAPGRISLENGRAFSNPRNLSIRRAFAQAVAPRAWELEEIFYLTDVVKCWPAKASGANRSPARTEIAACLERHLRLEFELIRPQLVLTFGVLASSAAFGCPVSLVSAHGKHHVTAAGMRVIPFMHPSTANVMGLRRVGLRSLSDYEVQLSTILRSELRDIALIE